MIRLRFFDENSRSKDGINRRLYKDQSFVLTAINRVSCFNRTVLAVLEVISCRLLKNVCS